MNSGPSATADLVRWRVTRPQLALGVESDVLAAMVPQVRSGYPRQMGDRRLVDEGAETATSDNDPGLDVVLGGSAVAGLLTPDVYPTSWMRNGWPRVASAARAASSGAIRRSACSIGSVMAVATSGSATGPKERRSARRRNFSTSSVEQPCTVGGEEMTADGELGTKRRRDLVRFIGAPRHAAETHRSADAGSPWSSHRQDRSR